MRRYSTLLVSCLFITGIIRGESGPESSIPAVVTPVASGVEDNTPKFETDKQGRRLVLDFSLSSSPVSDAHMKLSHFSNRKLLIYYFSAKCPHCQTAFPHIQKLSGELSSAGVTTIAIAVRNNSPDDVRGFIREYKVHLPVFHDHERLFGEHYGTGTIPLVLVVNEKGEYVRYRDFDPQETPSLIKTDIQALLVKR